MRSIPRRALRRVPYRALSLAATLAATLATCAACAAPPPDAPRGAPLAAAPGLVRGFDAPEEATRWRVGDHALFRVQLDAEGQRTERWVRIEVLDPLDGGDLGVFREYKYSMNGERRSIAVPLLGVAIDVYTEDGTLVAADRAQVPESFLAAGFWPMAKDTVQGWPQATEHPQDYPLERLLSWLALTTYLELIQASDALSPIFWRVVERPPIWRLLTGIKLSISEPDTGTVAEELRLPAPIGTRAGYRLPFGLDLNGQRAVDVELLVLEPRPPFLITGGALQLVATHPRRARRATIELVESRRGTGAEFRRDYIVLDPGRDQRP